MLRYKSHVGQVRVQRVQVWLMVLTKTENKCVCVRSGVLHEVCVPPNPRWWHVRGPRPYHDQHQRCAMHRLHRRHVTRTHRTGWCHDTAMVLWCKLSYPLLSGTRSWSSSVQSAMSSVWTVSVVTVRHAWTSGSSFVTLWLDTRCHVQVRGQRQVCFCPPADSHTHETCMFCYKVNFTCWWWRPDQWQRTAR